MTVVAITRWARPPAQELEPLAAVLNLALPDARLLLSGPLPLICAKGDGARALSLVSELRSRGHGAVSYPLADLPDGDHIVAPRTYSFRDREFVADRPVGEPLCMAFDDIVALVRARVAQSSSTTTTTTTKKLSVGRAIATGGLVMRKKHTSEARQRDENREQVLYVVGAAGRDWVCMRERGLRHQGLGSRIGRTTMENFATLVQLLREAAPEAFYDDRLMRQRRQANQILQTATEQARSTESECYLVANLIVGGHIEHQL